MHTDARQYHPSAAIGRWYRRDEMNTTTPSPTGLDRLKAAARAKRQALNDYTMSLAVYPRGDAALAAAAWDAETALWDVMRSVGLRELPADILDD